MSDFDDLLKDTAARLFTDLCTRDALDSAENGRWPDRIWSAVEAAGLTSALDPETDGASLLPLETLAVIVRAVGEFAAPMPLAETLLAQRIFFQAGISFPDGPLSVAPQLGGKPPQLSRSEAGWQINGHVRRVPWGRNIKAIAVVAQYRGQLALVRLDGLTPVRLGKNLANEPRDDFQLVEHILADDAVATDMVAPLNSLEREGALMRSLQMIGAMGHVLGQTVQYSMERVQFGRAIAKFQAVQQQVALMAAHVAAATAATEAALNVAANRQAEFEICAAKARTSEAAGVCCNVAHQVHGAMGFTHEHSLHLSTRRLMSWRDEFGSEAECAEWIGHQVQQIGGAHLWSYISTPQLHEALQARQEISHA
ncbi:acyl-CoA dehydrogenase family protein [Noviherbaspirillum sp. Root189]|uniref:acyl-CoA dehydrogenase family protein n=1 Tax=Noviherbaspirillum sp. Root189 TaxID=1736487 RepID=UPI00070C8BA0|nr:acyl-CoA dehydrogenase family protein [Noviherbaspirillum sp. Root189]KRB75744.1 hypothetical protein ASE07_26400 [Noviherbaspirillum sp. Root189]